MGVAAGVTLGLVGLFSGVPNMFGSDNPHEALDKIADEWKSTLFPVSSVELLTSAMSTADSSGVGPDLSSTKETILVDGKSFSVQLGDLLGSFQGKVVYGLVSRPAWSVQYQVGPSGASHPSVRAFAFNRFLQSAVAAGPPVAPKVFSLSPPSYARRGVVETAKTKFATDRGTAKGVAEGEVRFIVSERVESGVREYVSKLAKGEVGRYETIVEITQQLVNALRRIHEAGVVHGDVRVDNIAVLRSVAPSSFFRSTSSSLPPSVGFVGFDRASLSAENARTPSRPHKRLADADTGKSPFELEGFRLSLRDELFRLIWVSANLFTNNAAEQYASSLNAEALLSFKQSGNLFDPPVGGGWMNDLPFNTRKLVRQRFLKILDLVRNVKGIDDFPPYGAVSHELSAIAGLFRQVPRDPTYAAQR